MRASRLFPTLLLGCSLTLSARAETQALRPLSYDLGADVAVTGAAAASVLTLELLKGELAPLACHWCQPGSLDGGLSRSATWSDPHLANTLSTLLALAVPAGLMGYGLLEARRSGDLNAGWADALLIAEAVSIAMLANQIVKYSVGRARPYVWQGRSGLYDDPHDANLSLFSGHVTLAFATAVAAGTIFLMQDLPGAPLVLASGLAAAALVGYLRLAADQHYLSDVLVGAAVGSLVGWAVPYLFHRGDQSATEPGALRPAPGGMAIVW